MSIFKKKAKLVSVSLLSSEEANNLLIELRRAIEALENLGPAIEKLESSTRELNRVADKTRANIRKQPLRPNQ